MCVLYGIITLQYHDATAVEGSLTYHIYTSALANRQDLGDKADIQSPPKENLMGYGSIICSYFWLLPTITMP